MKITIQDTRACGYCIRATKPWMESHGFDFKDFVRNGIEWDDMKHIEELVVHNAYEKAVAREEAENGK